MHIVADTLVTQGVQTLQSTVNIAYTGFTFGCDEVDFRRPQTHVHVDIRHVGRKAAEVVRTSAVDGTVARVGAVVQLLTHVCLPLRQVLAEGLQQVVGSRHYGEEVGSVVRRTGIDVLVIVLRVGILLAVVAADDTPERAVVEYLIFRQVDEVRVGLQRGIGIRQCLLIAAHVEVHP